MFDPVKEERDRNRWKLQRERKAQKRQDVQDQRNTGTYTNGMDQYYNDHGDPLPDIEIPNWAKALHRAHTAGSGMRHFNSFHEKYLNKPRTKPLPPKRSDAMRALLEENGVAVDADNNVAGYDGFQFLPNGRIRTPENDVISAIQFIHDYV